ncbi:MAG TPA: tetratricopeptide repeat protein [Polyangiaceae bacterium]|nr:tetratricopeptide repeat protein [Polyangiaceae bacterium]
MLAALGAAGAVGSASVVAGAASGALHRLALVKWLAATVIVGTAGAGVYAAVNHGQSSGTSVSRKSEGAPAALQGEPPPVTAPPRAVGEASAAPALPADGAHNDEASPAEPRSQLHRAATLGTASADKANAADVSSLEGEVTALDRARSALAAGDAARALTLLAEYEQAFPKGALRPEATYLRIQALSKSGQRDAARELAARFLAKHPSSPHAAQLQALLSR